MKQAAGKTARGKNPGIFRWKKFFRIVFGISWADTLAAGIFLILFLTFIPVFTYFYFAQDLTDKETLMNRNDAGVVLTDRDDRPFYTFHEGKYKTFAPLPQIAPVMQQAVIAAEDRDFYNHPGFSIKAIVRSLYDDITTRNFSYGGSTLTQQLVKNSLLNPRKHILRKYQELVLAYEVERRFSKEEILEMYLNSVYFGEGTFGVEEASRRYFNKSAKDLNLAEASLLAGILPAPSRLSPFRNNLQETKNRQNYVLRNMAKQNFITSDKAKSAASEKLNFQQTPEINNNEAIHFALMVQDELIKRYGEETLARSGFTVKTTLNMAYQRYAEGVVKKRVAELAPNRVSNGAAVVIDSKNGEVLALVGSADWQDENFGKVNVAANLRQPGSSFKPIIYALAFEERIITPATILQDRATTFPGNYKPRDYDDKFRGPVTARRALANSLNVPAVEVMNKVGVAQALEMAHRLGITSLEDPSRYGLSLVLGAGEVKLLDLTSAYTVFANQGLKNPTTLILKIENKRREAIFSYTPNPQPVLSPETAFLISSILSDNNARAEIFGNALTISRPAAVKTGTTEKYRDALTIGYTPSLTAGIWVGNNNGRSMDNIAGSLGAAPIWKDLMEKFLADTPIEQFNPPPSGDVSVYSCQGQREVKVEKKDEKNDKKVTVETKRENYTFREYFIEGTAPKNCAPLIAL